MQVILLCDRNIEFRGVLELSFCICILCLADMKIGGMDKLYLYIRQTDRLLQPAMENEVALWNSPRMPIIDMSKIKLTKSDKEWLKSKRKEMYLILLHLQLRLQLTMLF